MYAFIPLFFMFVYLFIYVFINSLIQELQIHPINTSSISQFTLSATKHQQTNKTKFRGLLNKMSHFEMSKHSNCFCQFLFYFDVFLDLNFQWKSSMISNL